MATISPAVRATSPTSSTVGERPLDESVAQWVVGVQFERVEEAPGALGDDLLGQRLPGKAVLVDLAGDVPVGVALAEPDGLVVAVDPGGAAWLFEGARGRGVRVLRRGRQLALPQAPLRTAERIEVRPGLPGLPQALAVGQGPRRLERGNHRSQPTFKRPDRAAQYFNIVRKRCRSCKVGPPT
jgi:hypothetical protein